MDGLSPVIVIFAAIQAAGTWLHPAIPFAAGQWLTLEQVGAHGEHACVPSASDDRFIVLAETMCEPSRRMGAGTAPLRPPLVQIAYSIRLAPGGQAFPSQPSDLGRLISEEEVEIVVAQEGRVVSCRSLGRLDRATEDLPFARGLCAALGTEAGVFTTLPDETRPQRARMRFSYFVDVHRPPGATSN